MSDRLRTVLICLLFVPLTAGLGWLGYTKVWPLAAPIFRVTREFDNRYPGHNLNLRVTRSGKEKALLFTVTSAFNPFEEKDRAEEMAGFIRELAARHLPSEGVSRLTVQFVSLEDLIKLKQGRVFKLEYSMPPAPTETAVNSEP